MTYVVHLSDFDEEKIIRYATEELEMVERSIDVLDFFTESEILEYLNKNYRTFIDKPFYYPNNSIRITSAYEKLLENIDKVPIEKIEELTKDLI